VSLPKFSIEINQLIRFFCTVNSGNPAIEQFLNRNDRDVEALGWIGKTFFKILDQSGVASEEQRYMIGIENIH
jgi:hypothetical protein